MRIAGWTKNDVFVASFEVEFFCKSLLIRWLQKVNFGQFFSGEKAVLFYAKGIILQSNINIKNNYYEESHSFLFHFRSFCIRMGK